MDQASVRMAVGATSTWESAGPQPVNSEDPTYQDPVVNNFGAGWGIDSGRVTAVATPSAVPDDTVYMGAADGGIWKTTDGGATWASIGDELDTQAIGAIAMARRSAGTRCTWAPGEASHEPGRLLRPRCLPIDRRGRHLRQGRRLPLRPQDGVQDPRSDERQARLRGDEPRPVPVEELRTTPGRSILAPGDTNTFGNFVSDVITLDETVVRLLAAIGWRGARLRTGSISRTTADRPGRRSARPRASLRRSGSAG